NSRAISRSRRVSGISTPSVSRLIRIDFNCSTAVAAMLPHAPSNAQGSSRTDRTANLLLVCRSTRTFENLTLHVVAHGGHGSGETRNYYRPSSGDTSQTPDLRKTYYRAHSSREVLRWSSARSV